MAYSSTPSIDHLPELPLDLFEQGGKLGYSEVAPVLTVRPEPVTVQRPEEPAAAQSRSSAQTRFYYTQLSYPKVVCYPRPEPEILAAIRLENEDEGLRQRNPDRHALSRSRLYYKLSRPGGLDFAWPALCIVHYGPWLGYVFEQESCIPHAPPDWTLESPDPGIFLQWFGSWHDIPSRPNLHVFMNDLVLYRTELMCCAGFKWCPTTQSCIPHQLTCQDIVPL